MLKIKKRNGEIVDFDENKIINAVNAAMIEVDGVLYETDTAKEIAEDVKSIIERSSKIVSVENIQDCIESLLMKSERPDVAKAYIRYRYKREVAREFKLDFFDEYGKKLAGINNENQNANVDAHSFGGRFGEASEVITKQYALDFILSKKSRENHLNNEIYIHDLGSYAVGMPNCLTIPIDDLAKNGVYIKGVRMIRPCGSLRSFLQNSAVYIQLQSLPQFGGVSYSHYDWSAVPYVRKSFTKHFIKGMQYIEKLSDYKIKRFKKWLKSKNGEDVVHFDDEELKQHHLEAWDYAMSAIEDEAYQGIEALYHNLNTLQSRSGNQLPFSSINYGTCTLPEGRLITKALLECSIDGIGEKHTTSIFPCGIFQCMKGVNRAPGEPNYDLFQLALKSTAKRLYPNYANVDWSGNAGYDINDPRTYFSTMGCRTANGWDINGFGQLKDGRGNICPVTIIMPTLAMEAKKMSDENLDDRYSAENIFLSILDKKIHEAKDMLIERFEYICSQPPESARFVYENGTMKGYVPEEGIRSALKHGTLAVGQIGLAETLQILIGKDHTTPKGMKLAKRIEELFKNRCAEFKEEYKLNFGVYYTPAENLCHTSLKKFRDKYGIIENVSDKEFFTNSMHVPVWKKMSPYEKIDIESQLTGFSSAGCITYVEFDSTISKNLEALEQVVNYALDHDIPYFAVNVPNDTCMDCGYTGEFNSNCPMCDGANIQQLRRVTGYLTGNYTTAFNMGKQDEVRHRVKHGGHFE